MQVSAYPTRADALAVARGWTPRATRCSLPRTTHVAARPVRVRVGKYRQQKRALTPSRAGSGRKSASTPGFLLASCCRGRSARAEFSEIRSSGVRVDRARAAARGAERLVVGARSGRPANRPCGAFLLGLIDRGRLLRRHDLLDEHGGRDVRAAADARRRLRDAAAGGVSRPVSGVDGPHDRPSDCRGSERPALFFVPAAWVATEFLRGYVFGGFPWVPLGNSQVTVLPVAQLASVVGVYGLSALVAFVNARLPMRC